MSTQRRWLLPFTHGVDTRALAYVVRLAESCDATLVAVALVCEPTEGGSQNIRLEYLQQSKDFLEVVKWKARRSSVPVERYEVLTTDVLQSLSLLVRDLRCDSIVLVTAERTSVLLHEHETKHLLTKPPTRLLLLRLPVPTKHKQIQRIRHTSIWLLSWLHRLALSRRYQNDTRRMQDASAVEEPSGIGMEEHHQI